MDTENYKILPWTRYRVDDDGTFAPLNSNPYFFTQHNFYTSDEYPIGPNPIHPFAMGTVINDYTIASHLTSKMLKRVPVSKLHEEINTEPTEMWQRVLDLKNKDIQE